MNDSPLIGLSRAEIHLWLADDRIGSERMGASRLLLNYEEKHREQRFHFQKDRDRYLVTRALVRTVLSRYEPIAPTDWVFSTNSYGRPYIDVATMGARDLFFNVSHTMGLIVLAVTKGREVGVDVENTHSREGLLDVANQVFSPTELKELVRLPAEDQPDRFFQYWTLKESYIKARGMGVSIPLKRFGFRLDQSGAIDLKIAPELADDPHNWQCWQFRPADGYVMALCAEHIEHARTKIIARKIISSGVEEIIPLQISRVSA